MSLRAADDDDGVPFAKLEGTGNDFVVVTDVDEASVGGWAALARRVCPRHTSVGADGLLVVLRPGAAGHPGGPHPQMRVFNADGSEAEMCGNGLRAVAWHLHRLGGAACPPEAAEPPRVPLATGRGVLLSRVVARGVVEVDMGAPLRLDAERGWPGREDVRYTRVSMGNPHCVVFCGSRGEWDAADLPALGRALGGASEAFPEGANVELVLPEGRGRLLQRTWERGVGETQACGTGACAVALAARRRGLVDGPSVDVVLGGGTLTIRWAGGDDDTVYMTGGARHVFEGRLPAA